MTANSVELSVISVGCSRPSLMPARQYLGDLGLRILQNGLRIFFHRHILRQKLPIELRSGEPRLDSFRGKL